jgi:hypothetical protein
LRIYKYRSDFSIVHSVGYRKPYLALLKALKETRPFFEGRVILFYMNAHCSDGDKPPFLLKNFRFFSFVAKSSIKSFSICEKGYSHV